MASRFPGPVRRWLPALTDGRRADSGSMRRCRWPAGRKTTPSKRAGYPCCWRSACRHWSMTRCARRNGRSHSFKTPQTPNQLPAVKSVIGGWNPEKTQTPQASVNADTGFHDLLESGLPPRPGHDGQFPCLFFANLPPALMDATARHLLDCRGTGHRRFCRRDQLWARSCQERLVVRVR